MLFVLYSFDIVNKSVQIGGNGALDEAMIVYLGKSDNVIHIPRKPHSTGLRYYVFCAILSATSRPVCYHVLPELRIPKYSPFDVLTDLYNNLPEDTRVSSTVDAYFGSVSWLMNHIDDSLVTMALNSARHLDMMELFGHQLQPHQYRTFTNERLMVTIWKDTKMLMTASNEFTFEPTGQITVTGIDTSNIQPLLSEGSIQVLHQQLTLEELQNLAKALGVSAGNFISQMLFLKFG